MFCGRPGGNSTGPIAPLLPVELGAGKVKFAQGIKACPPLDSKSPISRTSISPAGRLRAFRRRRLHLRSRRHSERER